MHVNCFFKEHFWSLLTQKYVVRISLPYGADPSGLGWTTGTKGQSRSPFDSLESLRRRVIILMEGGERDSYALERKSEKWHGFQLEPF